MKLGVRQVCPYTQGIAMMWITLLGTPNNFNVDMIWPNIKILYQNFEESAKCMEDPGTKFFQGFQKSTHKNLMVEGFKDGQRDCVSHQPPSSILRYQAPGQLLTIIRQHTSDECWAKS